MVRDYYELTKPGIIYGNAMTLAAGFILASNWSINFLLFFATLVGMSLVIASGCAFNNYIDRGIDSKMERTRNRPLVVGKISGKNAIWFGTVLGILGFVTIAFLTNTLTLLITFIGFFFYVVLYSLSKRHGVYGTLVGAVSGSVPLVVGYTGAKGVFDLGALLLFTILVLWQMAHFYAIAIRRLDDYSAAQIPVMPVKYGIQITKINIIFYIIAFLVVTHLLTVFGYTGYLYAIIMALVSLIWLVIAILGFRKNIDDSVWAKKLFLFSLIVLTSFCIIIPIDVALH